MNVEQRESQDNTLRMGPVIGLVHDLGKEHKIDEAYETLQPYLESNQVPSRFYPAVGWTIYRYIKKNMTALLPDQAQSIFGYYLNLCPHKPEMVQSYMMVLAVNYKKLHPQDFSLAGFCRLWGHDSFSEEDYMGQTVTAQDGKPRKYLPLAVKVATLLYKEVKSEKSPEAAVELLPFFTTVLHRCPDYEFTPLYIANLHAWKGDKTTAIAMLKKLLAGKQQWYLWKHLGDLIDSDDMKVSCYCKALTMIDKEEYLGEMHLALASLLLHSDTAQSAHELKTYVGTYERNGWKIKGMAYEIRSALGGVAPARDGKSYYRQHSTLAEDWLAADYPECDFVFTGIKSNASGKPRACLSNVKRHLFASMQPSPLLKRAKVGDIFTCHYNSAGNTRVVILTMHATRRNVNTRPAKAQAKDEVKTIEGKVTIRPDKPYAFLCDYYISPHLRQISGIVDGQAVKAVGKVQPDGRKRITKILPIK